MSIKAETVSYDLNNVPFEVLFFFTKSSESSDGNIFSYLLQLFLSFVCSPLIIERLCKVANLETFSKYSNYAMKF